MKRVCFGLLCIFLILCIACKPIYAVSAPTAVAPTPTVSATPTEMPNPEDQLFTGQGEEVEYRASGQAIDPYKAGSPMPDYWLYNSPDLRIEIKQVTDTKNVETYYVADIRMRNEMREFTAFGSKKAPGFSRTKPYTLARLYRAVFALNGDYLTYEEKELKGILIRDGMLYYEGNKEDTLAFFPDMSLRVYGPGETTGQQLLDQGVVNTLSFGPTMVKDGALVQKMKNVRHINGSLNPRSGIGMVAPGHLIAIVVEGRLPRSRGMTLQQFGQLFVDQGCTIAYNLDGSASANMVFLGNNCNSCVNDGMTYLGARPLVDMICFGTSALCPGTRAPYYNNGQILSADYHTPSPKPSESPAP